ITMGFGIAGALWWWEKQVGAIRAYAIFLSGHVVATLCAWLVIQHAVLSGRYPESVRTALDYGVSYGAEAMLAACTVVMTGFRRWVWLAAGRARQDVPWNAQAALAPGLAERVIE